MSTRKANRARVVVRANWLPIVPSLVFFAAVAGLRIHIVGDILLPVLIMAPLFTFFGWVTLRIFKTKVVMALDSVSWHDAHHQKTVNYRDIMRVRLNRAMAFDARSPQWLVLTLAAPSPDLDALETSFGRWIASNSGDKNTVTFDLTDFDLKSIAFVLLTLSHRAPHTQIILHHKISPPPFDTRDQIRLAELTAAFRKVGGQIELDPESGYCLKID